MSFFDNLFGRTTESTESTSGDVVLEVGAERIAIATDQAAGKTLNELFNEYSDRLGVDAERISRFIDAGTIVPGTQTVQSGHVYRGTVVSETKQLS